VGPIADHDYAKQIRTSITRARLDGVVRMTGRVANVATHVRDWDLFVSLSSDEGQGLAILEAMALGVPVAARPVAGVSDFLVDRGTGFALTSDRAAVVGREMRAALADERALRRIAQRARRLVERRYAWDGTTAAFDKLYWNGGA
jgi:glycogen(starch) synthase